MSRYQLFNGEFRNEDELLFDSDNRSFRYGDGFFESLKVANGRALNIQTHWKRLESTADFLQMALPENLTIKTFDIWISELCKRNGSVNARIRFKAYRSGSGAYCPDGKNMAWTMTAQPMENTEFVLNKKGLTVGLFREQAVIPAPLSNYKTSSSLPYILGTLHAQKMRWDDCLMLDSDSCLVEATGSNLFLVSGRTLITPDLSTGGLKGAMRDQILRIATKIGLECDLSLVDEEDLTKADECFLTNSINGIQWVGAFGKKRYFHRMAEKLIVELNRENKLS